MKVVYAPEKNVPTDNLIIFLAGSIEMGKAIDWQSEIIALLGKRNLTVLNPRRKDWDSSWKQDPANPQFREQVEWELNGLEAADIVFFYFDPKTQSPISLMELGLMLGKSKEVVVCCPKEFHRWANVVITCQSEGVEVYNDLKWALAALETSIKEISL
jgi:nucleoside 2-deoxyribosyltransferase